MRIIDNHITNLRKQTSQLTEEIRRLTTNEKLTSKLTKNRNWMTFEITNKRTNQRLKELKEKKIGQLRSKKMKRKRELLSHKRRIAYKQFDRSESSFCDRCRNTIKSDINNERPGIHRQNTTAVNNRRLMLPDSKRLQRLWRPIWETENKANLEAKWIHTG